MITQERLKELLNYCPETGLFTKAESGELAGVDNGRGYITIFVSGASYKAHRLAWLYVHGEFPPEQIDHINGVRDDNRMINLRAASNQENHRNEKKRVTNTSGHCGVFLNKHRNRWQAYIMVGYKQQHLGSFSPDFEGKMMALAARKNAEEKHGFHPNHGSPRQL